MRIENDRIIFNSTEENYEKEASGIKNNTVRVIKNDECEKWRHIGFSYIQINKRNSNIHFVREVSDITKMTIGDLPVYIFSWMD